MKRFGAAPAVVGRVWSLMIALTLVLSALPVLADTVNAQEQVSITVTTTDVDGVTPMPFVRVRASASDGTVYGPRETGLQGTVTFQVDLTSPDMTVTVDAETPPACGIAPDPQTAGPFVAGEAVGVTLPIGTESGCSLGTLAVYAYDCPSGFDSTATTYEAWRDGCTEERNNVQFTFASQSLGQSWNTITGQWGIPARAPIVGLPPGAYTLAESNPASDQTSTFFCYTYATPNYVTSPNPTSIDRVDAPGGVATVNLNANRISCDVFQSDAPAQEDPTEQPQEEPTIDDGSNGSDEPPSVIGTATTTTDLNLRDGPSGESQVLLQMPTGSEVGILGDPQNGFYPVRYQNQDGWASGEFLNIGGEIGQPTETTEPEATATATTQSLLPVEPVGQAVTTSDVNFRDAPSATESNVIAVVPGGSQVDILGDPQNGFYPVSFSGQSGWISGDFLQIGDEVDQADEPTATTTSTLEALPSATSEIPPTATAVVIQIPDQPLGTAVTNDSVNFRNGPSSEASVLFELPVAAIVDILGVPQNGFYPVRYQDQSGWVSEIFLDIETPTATATATTELIPTATSTVAPIGIAFTTSDVNMRAAADPDSEVLQVLLPNTQVEVLGPESNGFLPIRYNGQDGFASAQFLSLDAPATATATETVGAAAEDPARIEFHKSVCPAGYDPAGPIFDDCHEEGLDNITFFVEGPEDFETQGVTARNGGVGPGIVIFEDLAPGTYTINEDVPGDFTSINVFCSMADSDDVVPFEYVDAIQGIAIELAAGQSVICDWYNIPDEQDTATASLILHKAVCPAGYVPGDTIFDDCHGDGLANITFTITGEGEFSDTAVTSIPQTPGPGVATFDGLLAGTFTVSEDVPGDFTSIYVYCEMADSEEVVPFTYNDGVQGIDIALSEGMSVVCDWYNIPDTQGADEGTASIELHKLLCDPGYEPAGGIYQDCHDQGLGGVTFTLEGPNEFVDTDETEIIISPGPGIASFSSLFPGTYSITEDLDQDGMTISVYCSPANQQGPAIDISYNDAGGIDLDLAEGQQIICDWYNIPPPVEEEGSVEVLKRTCPVGYDEEEADFNDFYNDCKSVTNDVTFTLTPDGGEPVSRDTGDDGNGRALFSGLALGDYTLSEDLPGEFVTRYAYCGPDDRNLSATTVVNGAVDLELTESNPDAVCLWFNVPEDLSGLTGQISLTKYLCPEGTTSNYWQKCSGTPLSGATFHLNGPGEIDSSAVTGNNGFVLFDELPAGNYTIQEVPPAGTEVAVYVVACQAGGSAYKFTYDDSNGMKIKLNLPVEGEIHCNWYNVPPKKELPPPPVGGGNGTITVHKFLCTGKAIAQYDWENDCLVQTSPEGFALSNLAGTQLAQGTTNANGIIVFTGLANGTYTLDETTGDWCHAEADFVDAAGNLIVKNGGNTDVFIYNCGARQVGTLPVTGSGDTAIGSSVSNLFMPAASVFAALVILAGLTMRGRLFGTRVARI